jgi:hypothetical protein
VTGPNPILESLENEWDAGRRWTAAHFIPHRHPQTPATAPVNLAAAPAAAAKQEDTMSLATLDDEVTNDLTKGMDWLEGLVARVKAAAPGIIATSEAVGGSTVSALVEAVAGRILPPQMESILATMVKDFVDRYAPAQVTAPAQPVAPAQ